MNESLKTCRLVQRCVMVVCGTLLVFAFSAGDPVPYERALDELSVIGEYANEDLTRFISDDWLVVRRSDDEVLPIYEKSNEALRRFADALSRSMTMLGANIDEERVFEETIFRPGTLARVEGWDRPDLYITLPPVARPTVKATLTYLQRTNLEAQIIVLPSEADCLYPHIKRAARQSGKDLNGLTLKSVQLIDQEIGKGLIQDYESRPLSTPRATFRFSFEKDGQQEEPLTVIDAVVPMNRAEFPVDSDEWLALKRAWYKHRGSEVMDEFTDLRQLMPEIQNLTLTDAIDWLNRKAKDNRESTTVVGVSVKQDIVALVGPLVVITLLLYFVASVSHLQAIIRAGIEIDVGFPWEPISPSTLSRFVGSLSVLILPGLTSVVLNIFLGQQWLPWFLSFGVFVISVAAFVQLRSLHYDWTAGDRGGGEPAA